METQVNKGGETVGGPKNCVLVVRARCTCSWMHPGCLGAPLSGPLGRGYLWERTRVHLNEWTGTWKRGGGGWEGVMLRSPLTFRG